MAVLVETPFPDGGRFAPIRLLGRGGMGAVYEAEDRVRGGRVALKVMLRGDPERLLRFKREFRIVADLHHPNLVRLFDLSVEESCWFFTMELVDGQPLTEVLSRPDDTGARFTDADVTALTAAPGAAGRAPPIPGELPEAACDVDVFRNVVGQLLDALEHLHAHGIVHRDLKPSNVLVDVQGTVRLLDFGLANRLDSSQQITALGMVAGTLGYMSPEQARGEAVTAASDLYSLGCLMFRLLTGRLPFDGSDAQLLHGHLRGPPPRVDRRVRGVPAEVADVCFRLLAQDPAARPTIADVRAALGKRPAPAPRGGAAADGAARLVGRDAELSALRACLAREGPSAARLVLVSGPSGIGKSALVDRAIEEAVARGHQAFRGRCYEREQLPFMTLDRAVDAMIVTLAAWPAERRAPGEPAFRDLQRPFPAMAMLTRISSPSDLHPRGGPVPVDVVQTYRRFGEVVALLARERPVVLALDDLQWADDESIELLEVLLADDRDGLTVVGTCRPEALEPGRPGARLLAAAGAAGTSIALAPLADGEARALLDRVAGGGVDPATRAAIAEQAGGNPFLLVELSHRFGLGAPAFKEHSRTAAGVVSVLLSDLSPEASRVLAVAAAAGGDVSEGLLVEASGVHGADFDRALGELFARRLVKRLASDAAAAGVPAPDRDASEQPAAAEARLSRRLDLYHDRIREAAYQALAPEQRRSLHEDIARILEANVSRHARDIEALLRHWTLAGDLERRRRFALQASQRAEKQLAYRHAARLLRIVLDAPDAGEPPHVTIERWEHLGDLHAWSGQLAAAAEAYERALEGWEAASPGEARTIALLRVRGHLGEMRMLSGDVARGLAVLEAGARLAGFSLRRSAAVQGLVLLVLALRVTLAPLVARVRRPGASALGPALLAFLGCVTRTAMPVSPAMAIEAALRGELHAWRVRDIRVLVRARAARAVVPALVGRLSPRGFRRAWLALKEADALARESDDADGACVVRAHEGLLWLRTDMQRGRAALESALAGLAQRGMSDSYDGARARFYLLIALMLKGDHRDVVALAEREIARSPENVYNQVLARSLRGQALAYLGRADEAEADLSALRRLLAPIPVCALYSIEALTRSIVRTAQGRFDEALEETLSFERRARAQRIRRGGLQRTAATEAALEACLGLARAGRLSARQRSLAVGWADWLTRRGVTIYGCMGHRARALLAHHAGDAAAARRALERALEASATNAGRWHRYVCLEAARDITGLTSSQEEEAAQLRQAGGLAEPFCRLAPAPARAGVNTASSPGDGGGSAAS